MNIRRVIHKLRSLWGPYVRRMTEPRWMSRLQRAEFAWRDDFAKLTRDAAKEVSHYKKEASDEHDKAVEAIRRVSRIEYARAGQRGEICVQVMIPAMELAAYDGHKDEAFFRHTARYVGHMLEREFSQLNMTTLAQAIHASERRQYELDRQRPSIWSDTR